MNVAPLDGIEGVFELERKGGSILFLASVTRHCSMFPVRELALKSVLPEATNRGRREGRPLLVGRLGRRFPFGRC